MKTKIIIALIILFILITAGIVLIKSFLPPQSFPNDSLEEGTVINQENILLDVPFVVQAPFANWADPIFQSACEEAAILMAMHWAWDLPITNQEAYNKILEISEFEEKNYGTYHDTSAADTVVLIKDYFEYQNVRLEEEITLQDIKTELEKNNLVIVPINGRVIGNPHYTLPGPERHMLVIIGYDYDAGEFVTNDAGTRFGKQYYYPENQLYQAIRDYETGDKLPITEIRKPMIVFWE